MEIPESIRSIAIEEPRVHIISAYPPIFFDHNSGILPVQSNAGFIAYRTTDGGDKWTPTTALDSSNAQVMEWDFVSMNIMDLLQIDTNSL